MKNCNFGKGQEMLKKITLVILAAVLLLAVIESLTAQPRPQGRGFRDRSDKDMPAAQEQPPVPANEEEKKILSILDDMNLNESRGMMNVPPVDGRLLRLLTEAVGAKNVVEIGTSNGYSGIWLCLALRTTGGKLTTYEIDSHRASLARENFKRAGVDELVTLVEGDAHKEVTKLKEQIDIVFIDADKEGYIDYLNKLLPLVRPGGLILAHNVNMRGGRQNVQDYVQAVTTNPELETVFYEQGGGISVTLKKRQSK
jgi:predicted O-methyltransferase YrrM